MTATITNANKRKAHDQGDSPQKVQALTLQGSEIPFKEFVSYSKVIEQWHNRATLYKEFSSLYTEDDKALLDSSFTLTHILSCQTLCEHEEGMHYFVTKAGKNVHSLGVARIHGEEAEILYIATDPYDLPLKDRLKKRVRGGGTQIVRSLAERCTRILVRPKYGSLPFYEKVGFVPLNDGVLVLEKKPLKA